MDGVPYLQPLAGRQRQYMPWGVLLVRTIGHRPRPVPPQAADQRSRAYPTLLRVLRWGRYGHRGGPQTPEVGPLACVSCGPLLSRPPLSLCWLRWWVFRHSWVGCGGSGWGAAPRHSWPRCLCAYPRHSWLRLAAGGGGWSLATWLRVFGVAPRHSWLESAGVAGGVALRHSWLRSAGFWGVVLAGGPSLLLAEGPG